VKRVLVAAALALVAVGCAEDATPIDAPSEGQAAPIVTTPATDVAATASTAAPADFGSRYNGSPVAFWFWAPY
jgi:PBP1b-binding outer membrane lipoprotein LpoB